MTTETLERPNVAKKRGRPDKGRNDVSVRLDAFLANLARIIARDRKQSLAEYLSAITAPIIERDARKLGQRLSRLDEAEN